VVPIYSEFGEAVGLATRKPSTAPGNSWWNMPAPFKKGNYLFMLDKARKAIFAKNKAYIVEGYMDALIPNQAGLDNVVSIMGTATTLRRIGLLARYCNNVCICMDADENKAGQNAQDLAVSLLRRFDFCESISVIMGLPIGVDPDEYVMEYGLNKFLSLEKTLSASEIRKICKEVESRQRFKPKHDNTK
jgi:DNA primase